MHRIGVNVFVACILGTLFIKAGNEGSRVLDNYNLLFAILIHQGMTTMMLTVLTCKSIVYGMQDFKKFINLFFVR